MNAMQKATLQGYKAYSKEEISIGAVIVKDNKIISSAHNTREKSQIATHHAEILAIEKACKKLKSWRLDDCDIYVTLEPCPMCAGAIANARIKEVVFGAYEEKSGCAISKYPILTDSGLNHVVSYQGGVLIEECKALLKEYFNVVFIFSQS